MNTFPELNKGKKPVTLIIGILCRDGIALASDSQTTDEYSMARTDATKIYRIQLADKTSGLVATAGNVEWGIQAIEIIESLAKDASLEHSRSFADLAEKANAQIKQKERSPFRRNSKELKQHFEERRCVLAIANYFKGIPYFYTLTSDGLVSPTVLKNQPFTSIGNSYALANYILKKFNYSDLGVGIAEIIAIYAINEVIQAKDASCYYPIQVGYVFPRVPEQPSGESFALMSDAELVAEATAIVTSETKNIEKALSIQLTGVFMDVFQILERKVEALKQRSIELENRLSELKKTQPHE